MLLQMHITLTYGQSLSGIKKMMNSITVRVHMMLLMHKLHKILWLIEATSSLGAVDLDGVSFVRKYQLQIHIKTIGVVIML